MNQILAAPGAVTYCTQCSSPEGITAPSAVRIPDYCIQCCSHDPSALLWNAPSAYLIIVAIQDARIKGTRNHAFDVGGASKRERNADVTRTHSA